jgi:hypothetical protein
MFWPVPTNRPRSESCETIRKHPEAVSNSFIMLSVEIMKHSLLEQNETYVVRVYKIKYMQRCYNLQRSICYLDPSSKLDQKAPMYILFPTQISDPYV